MFKLDEFIQHWDRLAKHRTFGAGGASRVVLALLVGMQGSMRLWPPIGPPSVAAWFWGPRWRLHFASVLRGQWPKWFSWIQVHSCVGSHPPHAPARAVVTLRWDLSLLTSLWQCHATSHLVFNLPQERNDPLGWALLPWHALLLNAILRFSLQMDLISPIWLGHAIGKGRSSRR